MSRAEYFARECRKFLALAHVLEVAGNIKDADGIGAKAANKLQQAYSIGLLEDKVVPLPPPESDPFWDCVSLLTPVHAHLGATKFHTAPSLIVPCPACDGGYRDVGGHTIRCGQCRGTGQVATNGWER